MPASQNSNQLLGILLLIIVNIAWVLSSEITKYLYNDLNFKRPFFATYIKSCMFVLFLIRFAFSNESILSSNNSHTFSEINYSNLPNNGSDDEYELQSLTAAEFELLMSDADDVEKIGNLTNKTDPSTIMDNTFKCTNDKIDFSIENAIFFDSTNNKRNKRRVHFAMFREVRSFPENIQKDAKQARLSYKPPILQWSCDCFYKYNLLVFNYSCYLAPLWFLTSFSYQLALIYNSVSTVNLISASSPLFVLILSGIFINRNSERFTCGKLFLVLLNISGVAIVSQFSTSLFGASITLFSAVTYAIYLVFFSYITNKYGRVNMNLLFGIIGAFTLIICTPLMIIIHFTGIEPQTPLPTKEQLGILIFSSFVGSLFADYVWLYATLLTNSLISSISLTLSIPLAMFADSTFRGQPPDFLQIIASIPIMFSFVGALLIANPSPAPNGFFSINYQHNSCFYFCSKCLNFFSKDSLYKLNKFSTVAKRQRKLRETFDFSMNSRNEIINLFDSTNDDEP